MPTYRIEIANNNRAGCQNKECKDAGRKIEKGELRFGNMAVIRDNNTWKFKHW